jgi:hypothetical protein
MEAISAPVRLIAGISNHNFLNRIAGDKITVQVGMAVTTEDLTTPPAAAFYSEITTRRYGMQGDAITIRGSNLADLPAVHELAQLDGGVEPQGDMLLAFVDGTLRVAVGRMDGRVVADPFHLTRELGDLVKARMASERPRGGGLHGWLARMAPATRREVRA